MSTKNGRASKPYTPERVNRIIDEVIKDLAAERFKLGIEGVKELAQLYKSAGQSRQTYLDLMRYIENEATDRSGNPALRNRIQEALKLDALTTTPKIIIAGRLH